MESRTSQLQGETVSHHCQYGRKTRKSCPVSLFCLPKGCCISGPLDFAAFLLILTQPFYSRRKSQSCLFSPLTSAQIPLFLVSRGVTSGNPSSSPEGPFPPPLGADSSLEGVPPPSLRSPSQQQALCLFPLALSLTASVRHLCHCPGPAGIHQECLSVAHSCFSVTGVTLQWQAGARRPSSSEDEEMQA